MKKKTQCEFVQEINTINPNISVLGNYINTNTKILCECKKCSYQWMVRPYSLIGGTGCPQCAGNIKKTHHEFVEELHSISPEIEVTSSYSGWEKKIKVRCAICGNEWETLAGKLLQGRGCPKCNFRYHTSFPEQAIYFYIKKFFSDAISSYKVKGYELDIFIPSRNVAIEYDGYLWHKAKIKLDNEKDNKCKKDGLTLIRVREKGLETTTSSVNIIRQNNESLVDLDRCINSIFSSLGISAPRIDVTNDRQKILSAYIQKKNDNSVSTTHPELVKDWDLQNNNGLLPEMFSSGSSENIKWKCHICGHSWIATISDRANGNGCPACSRRVATKGKNDVATVYPEIASEWNYERNGVLMPEEMLPGSSKIVWWKCKTCGGEWKATIGNRCKKKSTGCPYCYGRIAYSGKNDLKTVNPDLANEWHPTKNGEITPEVILPNSNKKVWWKCKRCGHEWQAVVSNRTKGSKCPKCAQSKKNGL